MRRIIFFLVAVLLVSSVSAQGVGFEPKKYNDYLELVYNTDRCAINCHAIIKVTNPTASTIVISPANFNLWYIKDKGAKDLISLSDVYHKPRTIKDRFNNYTFDVERNKSTIIGNYTQDRTVYDKKRISEESITLKPGESVNITIEGRKELTTGENNVDWKINFLGFEPGWSWWNSSLIYRDIINVTAGDGDTVNRGHPVKLTFDHEALVDAGKSQRDGDDLFIVYNDTTSGLLHELARALYGNDTSSAVIWFGSNKSIAGNGYDAEYYLYYGDPDMGPQTPDLDEVFSAYLDKSKIKNSWYLEEAGDSATFTDTAGGCDATNIDIDANDQYSHSWGWTQHGLDLDAEYATLGTCNSLDVAIDADVSVIAWVRQEATADAGKNRHVISSQGSGSEPNGRFIPMYTGQQNQDYAKGNMRNGGTYATELNDGLTHLGEFMFRIYSFDNSANEHYVIINGTLTQTAGNSLSQLNVGTRGAIGADYWAGAYGDKWYGKVNMIVITSEFISEADATLYYTTTEPSASLMGVEESLFPTAVLNSPANDTEVSQGDAQVFNSTGTMGGAYNFSNATLYVYNSSGDVAYSNFTDSVSSGTPTLLSLRLEVLGAYSWTVEYRDDNNLNVTPGNWTFSVNATSLTLGENWTCGDTLYIAGADFPYTYQECNGSCFQLGYYSGDLSEVLLCIPPSSDSQNVTFYDLDSDLFNFTHVPTFLIYSTWNFTGFEADLNNISVWTGGDLILYGETSDANGEVYYQNSSLTFNTETNFFFTSSYGTTTTTTTTVTTTTTTVTTTTTTATTTTLTSTYRTPMFECLSELDLKCLYTIMWLDRFGNWIYLLAIIPVLLVVLVRTNSILYTAMVLLIYLGIFTTFSLPPPANIFGLVLILLGIGSGLYKLIFQ